MINDDGTPNTEPWLSDTDIDAFLDKVDADYEALPAAERLRLSRSVQQAQREIIQSDVIAERDEAHHDAQQAEKDAAGARERARQVRARVDQGRADKPTRAGGSSPTFAQEVRRLRTERGLSLTRLGSLVSYSKGYLSKIENGQVRPNPEMARVFDDVLRADGRLIELADAPARPIPSDHMVLHTYESMFDHHLALGHRQSPEVVLMGLRPQVDILSSMARSADEPGVSRSLWLLAARYAEYAGWMEQERGDDAAAAELTKRAVQYARNGGDEEMEAYALVRAAEFALYRGDARATVAFARRAGRFRFTAVQAVAAQREAQGYALAGAEAPCRAALDKAVELQRAVAKSPGGATSPVDQVAIARAWSFHDLGRHAEAAAILDTQVPLIAPANMRARTRFGLRRALAHAAAGDVDHACELVSGLLDDIRQVQSATVYVDLVAFSQLLSRLRPAAGREIAGEIAEILFGDPPPATVEATPLEIPQRIEPIFAVAADLPASSTGWTVEFEEADIAWLREIPLLSTP